LKEQETRDRAIEHVLRGALSRQAAGPLPDCLDGETLAAWTSDGLEPDRAAAVERHLSDCARCQALVATFVRTEPPVVRDPQTWFPIRWHLRWLVPLATAATALALWAVIPDRDVTRLPQSPAAEQRAATQAAPEQKPAVTTPSAALEVPAKPVEERQQVPSKSQRAAAPRDASSDLVKTEEGRRANQALRDEKGAADRLAKERAGTPLPVQETVTVAAEAPRGDTQKRSTVGTQTGAVGGAAPLLAARQLSRIDIASPNAPNRWRITGGRQVERSIDGGARWELVELSPPATPLTAGFSPAASVCWLVGPAGAAYLTTDGLHFARLSFPEPADLVAVHAIDARTATVTTADGRTFVTTDAGTTWAPQR
jgi:hypothetical protein